MRLIDRTRRAGHGHHGRRVLARHAREIVAGVGSARSAVGALRAMDTESLTVLTTPCIGSALFPGVTATLADRHPGCASCLTEHSGARRRARFPADGVVVAVLPTLTPPLAPGLREQLLWREPIRLAVNLGHELARRGILVGWTSWSGIRWWCAAPRRAGAAATARAAGWPGSAAGGGRHPADAGRDGPRGLGVGVPTRSRWSTPDTTGLVVLDVDDPDMGREVAAYWYDGAGRPGQAPGRRWLHLVTPAPRAGGRRRRPGRARR